jgi:hypothetical protein
VTPSGESHLLDDVFLDDEVCVKALWNEGVFKENCLPEEKDAAETLAFTLEKIDMFDEIYFHVKKEEGRLNTTNYPQPRRCIYGVIHS